MFSGIIEQIGHIRKIESEGSNVHFTVEAAFDESLYIDQSIAHNGVCLTVVSIDGNRYVVTAIQETLDRSNLGGLAVDAPVNLERAVSGSTRMDGHMVQGHVDAMATCTRIVDHDGSWEYTFEINPDDAYLLVDKGSVAINGTSLTVISPDKISFSVAIIPYTQEHTVFKYMKVGDTVNIEYDIIGKYVARYMELTRK